MKIYKLKPSIRKEEGRSTLGVVIGQLKSIASSRPTEKTQYTPFEYSKQISDEDEQDIAIVEDVYPSKVDPPKETPPGIAALEAWRQGCQVLISGINMPIGMIYQDAKGDLSKRQVEVKKIFRSNDYRRYFTGFCALRAAVRTFREDRVNELIDLETGYRYENPTQFFDKYSLFDTAKMEKLQVILHILSYLARSDRKFCDKEKDFISELITEYCRDDRQRLIESYAINHKVKKKDFLNEVSKLAYMDEDTATFLVHKAQGLIAIDGKITKKEKELFDNLQPNL
jgi:hypothetical protein